MDTTTQPPPQSALPDTDELSQLAQRFVLAMMGSASTIKIRPTDWWERARTALEYSARTAHNPRQMVTLFARKIQSETLTAQTAERLSCLSSIESPAAFSAFRRVVERESTYIIAMAQATRAEEREAAGIQRAALAPIEARLAQSQEDLREMRAERDRWRNRANDEAENARVLALKLKEV
jgi:uncharacterized protein (DUF1697 family)